MRFARFSPQENFCWLTAGLWLVFPVQAAITLDGTVGRAGALPGPDYQITADLGRQVGNNLFHSFGQFSINTGESATFSGPNSISNIIGRVTGGGVSFIDGALRSTIPGANLYLLNPAGVLFGEHATLDVPGSVHVSTADYLKLSDGGRFDARTPANSVLTVAPVAAFGFLSETPAPITVNGSFLQVPEGQTLSLIGGDLTLSNATLYAPAGRINIASVGSAGEVLSTATGLNLNGFTRWGDISVYHDPAVARPKMNGHILGDVNTSGRGGGAIFIRGGNLRAEGGWLLANTYGDQAGIGIDIALTGELVLTEGGWINAATLGEGDAGDIMLNVGQLDLIGGSQISSSTGGKGRGGDITLTARDAVTISGTDPSGAPSGLIAGASSNSIGDAGSITLDVGRLDLSGGGKIIAATLGAGRGGDITLTARGAVTISGTDPSGKIASGLSTDTGSTGDAGDITLNVDRLDLSGGGVIASNTAGTGRGGDITLTARDAVTISGTDPSGNLPSGLLAAALSSGDAGSITLDVGRFELSGGGQIITNTFGAGRGGDITLTARDAVTISGTDPSGNLPSGLFASAGSTGDAGNIDVTTPNLTLTDSGTISAISLSTTGGNIALNADHLKLLDGSTISSSVFGDQQSSNGGNVTINSTNFVALNGSSVTARSNQGTGGNIIVNADVFLHNAPSTADVLNASARRIGNDGTVTVNAPTTDISGSLVALDTNYLDAAAQLSHRCGTNDSESRSSFTLRGRGALPAGPDGALPAPAGRCESLSASPPTTGGPPVTGSRPVAIAQSSGFGDR